MNRILRTITFLTIAGVLGCSPMAKKQIITVNGPIPASALGITLSHEHVLVDFIGADSTGYHRWDREEVVNKVLPYLTEIKQHHVKTLVECTPAYLGRDPWLLKMLSSKSGLHIITNTGFYGAHANTYIPPEFFQLTAEQLSQIWVNEFRNGIEDSGVKPGFIKIGVDSDEMLSKEHLKLITAAGLAHKQTGLVIASHTGPDGPALEQIKVLKSLDINPSAFIWVHAQRGSLEGNIKAAEMGSWISLDNVNPNLPEGSTFDVNWYAERLLDLKEAGYLNRVLISHDAGWYKPEEENGGTFRGFTGIFTVLIPELEKNGFSQEDLKLLLEVNPSNAFSIKSVH
jgi:phosphotriesterase-related protein